MRSQHANKTLPKQKITAAKPTIVTEEERWLLEEVGPAASSAHRHFPLMFSHLLSAQAGGGGLEDARA